MEAILPVSWTKWKVRPWVSYVEPFIPLSHKHTLENFNEIN